MIKSQKNELIATLTQDFQASEAIAVCDYKGLDVKSLEQLRTATQGHAKVRVVKNTLASLALKNSGKEGYVLENMNVLVYGEDALGLSKVVAKFAKDQKNFIIKKAYLDGEFKEKSDLIALSKLPGREELLSMLLSVWQGPIRNFTIGLDNLSKSKEIN